MPDKCRFGGFMPFNDDVSIRCLPIAVNKPKNILQAECNFLT